MKFKAIKGEVFELDLNKKYLIVFDANLTTPEDASNLMKAMGAEGFKGLGFMMRTGNKLQIVAQADDALTDMKPSDPDPNTRLSKSPLTEAEKDNT